MDSVLIIAEAGVNHNGNITLAEKLIDAAAEAGADYVKFQSFKADKLVNKTVKKAGYQQKNLNEEDTTQYGMLKKLELSDEMHEHIISYCKIKDIKFLSTPFDVDSITLLKSYGVKIGKIPSGEITNLPYLRAMAKAFPQIILSTGLCTMQDIKNAVNALINAGMLKINITILHCNTEYPTPMSDVNLNAMLSIEKELGVKIGYSDHTLGIEVPIAAVALGAVVIEKHFTLDKTMPGPDHLASLEPDELKLMVAGIRNIEKALGTGIKEPSDSERKNIAIVRKYIVANTRIKKGELFSEDNLTVKRTGFGISPMEWDLIIGKPAMKDFDIDEVISI